MSQTWTAGNYALIDHDDIKDFVGQTSQEDKDRANFCIRSITDIIETYTRRKFQERKYWREIVRSQSGKFYTDNYPITELLVSDISDDFDIITQAGTTSASGSSINIIDDVNLTQVDDYWNGAIVSVNLSTGREVQPVADFDSGTNKLILASKDALSIAATDGITFGLVLRDVTSYDGNYTDNNIIDLDYEKGLLQISKRGKVVIDYRAGFVVIPYDIQQAAIVLCGEVLKHGFSYAGVKSFLFGVSETEVPSVRLRDVKNILKQWQRPRV